MQANRFLTRSLQDQRVGRILSAAIEAVDPARLVTDYLNQHQLPAHRRVFLLGVGKAAEGMTRAAAAFLRNVEGSLVVTKQAAPSNAETTLPTQEGAGSPLHSLRILEAGHPVPDDRSLAAGEAVQRSVANLNGDDLLICLLSGGASALVAAPLPGIPLVDLQSLTENLLRSGASINEMNVLRRKLDVLKGGGLAAATRASILSLILSDVIGDQLETIASGPTAPDPATPEQAMEILQKYRIRPRPAIERALFERTAHSLQLPWGRVSNVIIGNNRLALIGAREHAVREGFDAEILADDVEGEAREVGRQFAGTLQRAARGKPRPFCLVAGGETTVSLGDGSGKGGRNQEMALGAVDASDGLENVLIIALATDGNDGPTDAAGAVATGETHARAAALGMRSADYLADHNSYLFFEKLGDLMRPGYTGTNVNDLILLVGL